MAVRDLAAKGAGQRSAYRDAVAADFDYNYTPVNDQYPAIVPGNYIVSAGDTLRGIALAVYGDAQLWYLIADANGLQTDAELTVGSSLTIPNKVTNLRNAYDTFKPYEPGKIIGDLTPTLPEPPPPDDDDGDCGGFGRIIMLAVQIVVSYLVPGPLGAMLGNLAGQVVGNVLGIQDGISWKEVAKAGLSSFIGGQLGAEGSPLAGSDLPTVVARAAISNAITQGVSVAVGLQEKFDWRGVAAAAVGAGVSHVVGNAIGESQYGEERWAQIRNNPVELGRDFGNTFSRELVAGFASGVAKQVVYGGKANWASVIGDAFGNALGSSLAYSATAANSAAQQAGVLEEAEAWSGSGLKLGGGLGLKAPAGLADTWGGPIYPALADPLANFAQPSYPMDSVGWVPDELRGQRDLLFYRQQDLGYGRTLVSFNPYVEEAPDIPGMTMTSDGMRTYRATPADPWTSERTYVRSADPLGRSDAIDQGNGVWSYPVSMSDGIEVRILPPLTTQDEFQSKAEQGTFDHWNEFGNALTNGNWRRAWDAFNFVRNDAYQYRAQLLKPTPAQEKFNNDIGMAIAGPPTLAAAGIGAYFGGTSLLTWQMGRPVVTELTLRTTGAAMLRGAGISTGLYAYSTGEEGTPAGYLAAATAGAIGGGMKFGLNYAAALPNTMVPLSWSNFVTAATAYAHGYGAFGWLNGPPAPTGFFVSDYGRATSTDQSWWTSPVGGQKNKP